MPSNDPEYQKRYKSDHYKANKALYMAQAAARKRKLRDEIWELKREPCMDCEQSFNPWQMQFDHREGEIKKDHIATLMNNCSRAKLFEEIEKCDLVCANCHADRTFRRNQASMV